MIKHYILRILLYCSVTSLLIVTVAAGVVYRFKDGLPTFAELEDVEPARTTNILSADGAVLKKFWVQRREPVTYDQIPKDAVDALIAAEDQHYWQHWGVSIPDIFRALLRNILREGRLKGPGASTITQQLARNIYLTPDVTWTRKIQEQLTAVLLEQTYTKKEIIEKYFNRVLFGRGAYGIQSAARRFFAKPASELDLNECAYLVGLLQGPNFFSRPKNYDRAMARREYVLGRMLETGKISHAEYRSARQRPIIFKGLEEETGEAPYFTEYVRQYLEEKYGFSAIYKDGVSVYATLDSRIQRIAEDVLGNQLAEIQSNLDEKWRRNPPDSSYWTGLTTREDSLKATAVQGALVALDPRTGHILAMIGGRDFNESKWNRAVQAPRQPGSAFKPIIYTAAVDNGIPPTRKFPDTAVTVDMGDGSLWRPENYDRKFLGWMTMRQGLAMSRNVVTTKLLQEIGPRTAAGYARKMGITTRVLPYLSLGMGTSEVKLIDLVSAFGVLANKGILIQPAGILKIVDKYGNVLEERLQGEETAVLREETAAVMTSMLRSVMDLYERRDGTVWRGTGWAARSRYGFKRPAAGKTGTTQNFADTWFVGYTPQIVAGVWVGFDMRVSLGNRMSGAVVALPVWAKFMKQVHESLDLPVEDFEIPPSVVQMEVCGTTYQVASIYCPTRIEEVFVPGSEPKTPCREHTAVSARDLPDSKTKGKQKREYQF